MIESSPSQSKTEISDSLFQVYQKANPAKNIQSKTSFRVSRPKSNPISRPQSNPRDSILKPNYSIVSKKLGGVVEFGKLTGRKNIFTPRTPLNISIPELDLGCISKKIKVPNLSKSSSRPTHKILPHFMAGFSSRRDCISEKTLRMNSYPRRALPGLTSSFGKLSAVQIEGVHYKLKHPKLVQDYKTSQNSLFG